MDELALYHERQRRIAAESLAREATNLTALNVSARTRLLADAMEVVTYYFQARKWARVWKAAAKRRNQGRRAALGHDLIQLLIDGLEHEALSVIEPTELDALIEMLRTADLVVLHFGLEPSSSLATRESHV